MFHPSFNFFLQFFIFTRCFGPAPCFTYEWGRSDCSTSPVTDILDNFPVAEMNADQMFNYFDVNFGFNKQEVREHS